ncbi:hypothetical protein [Methanobrevibacter sp.]|uniref:hypothetical protein n=1 Tax=Methanobrevibacter sp. TaxID=66852 RepID=UPI00388E7612
MSEEEYIDFKKEFEDFKKELENSRPIFDDDSIEFNDFDNLISASEDSDLSDLFNSNNSNDSSSIINDYPNITLETDSILLNLIIKKDYSKIDDLDERKKEFFNDLREFIDEFESTEESNQLMKFYQK